MNSDAIPTQPLPTVEQLLGTPSPEPDPATLAALRAPIEEVAALDPSEIDRLLDPAPLDAENGWCWTREHVAYVAVRTPMPGHTAQMWDWWFDWHPREDARYRAWFPEAHFGTRFEPPPKAGAKPFWGATHYPDEDIGLGREVVRIEFRRPSEYGFSSDALDDPRVATIVGGYAGSPRRRVRAGVMTHVLLHADDGLVLRSRFWIGHGLRPDLPGIAGDLAGKLLDRPPVRRLALPERLPGALADHCAREYSRLSAILPALHERYAGAGS